jgi:hypothetical protein
MQETLERGNELSVPDYERGVRVMASETRFHRRVLTKCILERADRAKGGYIGSILPSARLNTHYVLLIGPGDGGIQQPTVLGRNSKIHAPYPIRVLR